MNFDTNFDMKIGNCVRFTQVWNGVGNLCRVALWIKCKKKLNSVADVYFDCLFGLNSAVRAVEQMFHKPLHNVKRDARDIKLGSGWCSEKYEFIQPKNKKKGQKSLCSQNKLVRIDQSSEKKKSKKFNPFHKLNEWRNYKNFLLKNHLSVN